MAVKSFMKQAPGRYCRHLRKIRVLQWPKLPVQAAENKLVFTPAKAFPAKHYIGMQGWPYQTEWPYQHIMLKA